jgi:hypothetical protein
MNKSNQLIYDIAIEYGIDKGNNETNVSFYSRVIYSLLSRMGYASLWDEITDEEMEAVSITHFKHRILGLLRAYVDIYPDMNKVFKDDNQIGDELYQLFVRVGIVYHNNYHSSPSIEKKAIAQNVCFTRGKKLSEKTLISGAGTYVKSNQTIDGYDDVKEMFQLPAERLDDQWKCLVKQAILNVEKNELKMEYMKLTPPFSNGYWTNMPSPNIVSLARCGNKGNWLYYLYRKRERVEFLQLPNWLVEDYEYRTLANGCLMNANMLPPAKYKIDGKITYLSQEYLYPPAELNFLKLYSWPIRYEDFPNDFKRILSTEIFMTIKVIFEAIGYKFVEEK